MTNDLAVISGAIIGAILFLIFVIITIVYCYQRCRLSSSKQGDSLHSIIVQKSSRSMSFISEDFHNNRTLLASPRRLALLELQQHEEIFTYENPSLDVNELIHERTMRF